MKNIKRSLVQFFTAIFANSNLPGFIQGRIYQGSLKQVCVPFLNCYSCPGALFACPVGSIQTVAAYGGRFSLYVFGLIFTFGAIAGRWICGWLCPFGFFQELMAKLSIKKYAIPRVLRLIKYLALFLTVLLPFVWIDPLTNLASPYFCKYICPAGTLEAGIPLLVTNGDLRSLVGGLFAFKLLFLFVWLILMAITYRPFCRVLCPLGAFYGLLNKYSLYKLNIEKSHCSSCGSCSIACPMNLQVTEELNSPECIRCLQCKKSCPNHALEYKVAIVADQRTSLPANQ